MAKRRVTLPALMPYVLLVVIGGALTPWLWSELGDRAEPVSWLEPGALVLLSACALLAWVSFHLRVHRAPTMAFSRVADLAMMRRGALSYLVTLPNVLRVLAVGLIALALARPQSYREEVIEVEGIDIMVVLDLSKSMEERDLRRNRLDAGQRTIRNFLRNREADRVGLVVFAQAAMLQAPLTTDYRALEQIVADLAIGDVPEMGTAIGDALALALANLRRSDAKSKVVILLSDGDSNVITKFDPLEAKKLAEQMGVRVFTILLGRESGAALGGGRYSVNPALLADIARDTGGMFFRAGDDAALEKSFETAAKTLEKTRRRVIGRVAHGELFALLVWPALILLLLELALRLTRWRRFP